jgi:phosphoglucomutase
MASSLEQFRTPIEEQFSKLSANTALVGNALKLLDAWLADPLCEALYGPLRAHIEKQQFGLLLDSFYQFIPFGTGGRRGRVGYGPNRINPVTVALSVQGYCNYLRATKSPSGRVVVAFDTRIFEDISGIYAFLGAGHPLLGLTSRLLAMSACEIYAGNGFEVCTPLLPSEGSPVFFSTPELSFSIRRLSALGGMNVSASHNHPDDNGFKFFNTEGAQDVPPSDQEMTGYMLDVKGVQRIPFETAVARGLIHPVPPDVHQQYLSTNLGLLSKPIPRGIKVVYTPLCGTGEATVGDLLRKAGVDVQVYAPQASFDGTFATVPFRLPNPEVPESGRPALIWAKQIDADIVLCTDPDADRLGAYARASDGTWRYLNGNEIGSILAYYLVADRVLGPRRSGLLIKTLVTTGMIEDIAEKAGCRIVGDLLVGFKYIANVLLRLERDGRYGEIEASPRDLVLAAEESHGFLLTPEIRDKDAAGAALILCELLSQLRATGRFLPEYLDALSLECGNYQSVSRSIVMRGIHGAELLTAMMHSLRENPPEELGGIPVRHRADLLSQEHGPLLSETDRQARNFLVFRLDGCQVVVRPSGTEPKAKIYVDLRGASLAGGADRVQAGRFARQLAVRILDDCIGRVGYRLSASANLLPDYIDLDLKTDFDTAFRRDLTAAVGTFAGLDAEGRLRWLRQRLASYAAGADPIDAAGAAIDSLCADLARESASSTFQQAIRDLQAIVAKARQPVEWTA